MTINAAESLKAFAPPVYVDRTGVSHTGKFFSAVEYEAVGEQLARFQRGEAKVADIQAVLTEMFDANVAAEIVGLPFELYSEALADFFGPRRSTPAAAVSPVAS